MRTYRHRRALPLFAALALLAVAAAPPAMADQKEKRELTVYTQNLYLGTGLNNLIGVTGTTFLVNTTQDWGRAKCITNFAPRADRIAAQIAEADADLIGLQEVSLWRTGPADSLPPINNRTPNATHVEMDFLDMLMAALKARGLEYEVAAAVTHADVEAPTFTLDENCTPTTGFTDVRLTDRDVILIKSNDPAISYSDPQTGRYVHQLQLPLGGSFVEFTRGWVRIKASFEGKRVNFFNTHLEVDTPAAAAAVQVAQADEAIAGPLVSDDGALIAVGDYNSAADGSTTATYDHLIASGLIDAWTVTHPGDPGLTCCHDQDLLETVASFDTRIDLVLGKGPVRALTSTVVGARYTPAAPYLAAWPSDHAGVVTTFRVH